MKKITLAEQQKDNVNKKRNLEKNLMKMTTKICCTSGREDETPLFCSFLKSNKHHLK